DAREPERPGDVPFEPLVGSEDRRGEGEAGRAFGPGGSHAQRLPLKRERPPLPGGEGVGGWGSAPQARVDPAGVEHPHPTLPLKGEGGMGCARDVERAVTTRHPTAPPRPRSDRKARRPLAPRAAAASSGRTWRHRFFL